MNTSLDISFNPPGENADLLNLERTSLAGQFVACVFYGMELLLYILTAHLMLTSPNRDARHRAFPKASQNSFARRLRSYIRSRDWRYFFYITIQFILCSLGIGGSLRNVTLSFVDDRAFVPPPGTDGLPGPIGWSNQFYNTRPSIIGNTAFIVSIWLQDGFLLYRFLIIWQYNWLAFVFPCLMYLASVAFSLLLLIQLSTLGLDINASTNQHVGIIFWSLSIALNVILTGLIVGRLGWVRRVVEKALTEYRDTSGTANAQNRSRTAKARIWIRSKGSGDDSLDEKAGASGSHPGLDSQTSSPVKENDDGEPGSHQPTMRIRMPAPETQTSHSRSSISYATFTRTYTSVGAMLIESAALYTAFNVSFLVTFIVSEAGSYILLTVVGVLAAFSPTLIAYRVMQGKGWSNDTAQLSSGIVFSPVEPRAPGSGIGGGMRGPVRGRDTLTFATVTGNEESFGEAV